jgi:hypothetical protein
MDLARHPASQSDGGVSRRGDTTAAAKVMPIHYERDDGKRRIVVTSAGAVTLDDALAIIDRQAAEGAWSYGVLYDARAALEAPTPAHLHQLVLRVGLLTTRHGPRGPVAFVVRHPALSTMAARYARLGDLTALDVRLFTTVSEAEHWLDEQR